MPISGGGHRGLARRAVSRVSNSRSSRKNRRNSRR